MQLNKVTLIGNITKDIELKKLPNGNSVASFNLATNRTWKDNNGQKQEQAEFHSIIVFGKQAETINQYCKKGDQLYIEGRLQTRSWEKDGEKKYRTEIVLESFQFGNKNEKSEKSVEKTAQQREEERPNETVYDEDGRALNVEDIPFN